MTLYGSLHQEDLALSSYHCTFTYKNLIITYIDIACEYCIVEQRGVASYHALGPLGVVWLGSSRHHVRVGTPLQATDSFQQRHRVPSDD